MLSLLTDSPHKLKLEKIHGTLIILFYVSLSSPQLQILFFIRNSKKATIQQMIGGKTLNLVLKMLERFLKIQKNIRISILKRRLRNLYKKKTSKQKLNR